MRKIKIEQEVDIEEMVKQLKTIDFDAVNKCIIETVTSVVNKLVEMYEEVCNSETMKVELQKPDCYGYYNNDEGLYCNDCKSKKHCIEETEQEKITKWYVDADGFKCFACNSSSICDKNDCIVYDLCKRETEKFERLQEELNEYKNKEAEPKPYCYCTGKFEKEVCTEESCKYYYDCDINKQYRKMQEYDFNARHEINSIKCFGKYNREKCLPNTCILYNLCKKTTKELKHE